MVDNRGATANEKLLDRGIAHAVYFQRLKTSTVLRIVGMLNETVLAEIERAIARELIDADSPEDSGALRRLQRVQELTREIAFTGFGIVRRRLTEMLREIAGYEAEWQVATMRSAAPAIAVRFGEPNPVMLRALVETRPFQGRVLSEWWQGVESDAQVRINEILTEGVATGRPTREIVARITGDEAVGDAPFNATRRNAEAVIRTATQEIATAARATTYEENRDLVKAWKFVATLDSRTCFRAGTLIRLSDGRQCPIEDVRAGDSVESGSGRARRVRGTKRAIASDWRRIVFADGQVVTCTSTHPFWTPDRGWIEARFIQPHRTTVGVRAMRGFDPSERGATAAVLLVDLLRAEQADARCVPMRSLQRECVAPSEQAAEFLLTCLLHGGARGGFSEARLRAVFETVYGAKDLRRALAGKWNALLSGLLGRVASRCATALVHPIRMRNLRARVRSASVVCSPRKVRPMVLRGLPSSQNNQDLPDVPLGIHDIRGSTGDSLFVRLLQEVEGGDATRSDGAGGNRVDRPRVQAGGSDRTLRHRFHDSVDGTSYRGGRSVLALQDEEARCRQGSGNQGCRSSPGADCSRFGVRHGPDCTSPGTQPAPTGAVLVVSVESLQFEEPCFDIEVEGDHSYLVADGLIAHNTLICASQDGKVWPIGEGRPPPLHFGCRSTTVPVLKSAAELGLRDLPPATRSSLDGAVPASVDYDAWLRGQPRVVQDDALGKERAKLFRGGLRIDRFVDDRLRVLSLDELRALERNANES